MRTSRPLAIAALLLAPLLPVEAGAEVVAWSTDPGVGPSQAVFTLDLDCSGGGLVCDVLDAYADTQAAALTGTGSVDLDEALDTLRFQQDSLQDVGQGPVSAYLTTAVGALTFVEIPFLGVPSTDPGVLFTLDDPAVAVAGLDLGVPADHPFVTTVDASALADVVGELDPYLSEIVLPPQPMTLNGTLRIGLAAPNGVVPWEIRDLSGTLFVQNPTVLLGENVTVHVLTDVTLNLSGTIGTPTAPIPLLPGWGWLVLVPMLAAAAGPAVRRRARARSA